MELRTFGILRFAKLHEQLEQTLEFTLFQPGKCSGDFRDQATACHIGTGRTDRRRSRRCSGSTACAGSRVSRTVVGAFRRGDKLNHFLGTSKPVLDHVGISAKRFCGESGGHAGFGKTGVLGHEPNFVDANARDLSISEIQLEALGERAGLRASLHEGFHQVTEVIARNAGGETDAGDAGVGE